ncbi:oxidoreductase [Colletotrichum truncatum]|uniref:Oxidoreductase n=1 Tax=Colletotrichum truncatum TaxID=5467 RepID=A0ACC3YE40_COLTU|nr:oxidoreductase [Colletotrichum truncatum]KAF6790184.1 oxidoreductase [Colletotrichum truncatum]
MASRYSKVHEFPAGPSDDRPVATQIIEDEGLEGNWQDKVILITGCSSGLGVETARALAITGATLYLTARDLEKAKAALGDLAQSDRVHLLRLDLSSLASVRACATEFNAKSSKLNIFIANAGVMMVPEGSTADGFETHLGTNHLAHFLLFELLKPLLLASSTTEFHSRAIFLSSIAHRTSEVNFDNLNLNSNYHPWVAYAQSKTANIWTANEIERRYGPRGLHSWSVQPGPTSTGLYRHMSEEDVAASRSDPALAKAFKSVAQGAATTVWAATAKVLEGKGGKYLEDCQISSPADPAAGPWAPGHALFAYDEQKEARLWTKSLQLTRLGI